MGWFSSAVKAVTGVVSSVASFVGLGGGGLGSIFGGGIFGNLAGFGVGKIYDVGSQEIPRRKVKR